MKKEILVELNFRRIGSAGDSTSVRKNEAGEFAHLSRSTCGVLTVSVTERRDFEEIQPSTVYV